MMKQRGGELSNGVEPRHTLQNNPHTPNLLFLLMLELTPHASLTISRHANVTTPMRRCLLS